jgi:hypothetical protein
VAQQPIQERHASFGEDVLQHRARQPVDLNDEQAALTDLRRSPAAQTPDGAIQGALAPEDKVVYSRKWKTANDRSACPACGFFWRA